MLSGPFAMKRFAHCVTVVAAVLASAGAVAWCAAQADRANLFPKFSVGQVFRYRIGYRADTRSDTASSVVAPMAPTGSHTDVQLRLLGEVTDFRLDAGRPLTRLRLRIADGDSATLLPVPSSADAAQSTGARHQETAPNYSTVELSLHADGQISDTSGLDKLSPDERAAWQEWLSRFAAAGVYPEKGVKPGDKWKAEEAIPSAILAALFWEKESQYVHDAPCGATEVTAQGDPAGTARAEETCAVILTTATLKQKSSSKDATPEDYKLHDLRTMGTASGRNDAISYISLKTGLLVRATEDGHQKMEATVTKSDGSNRVHYKIEAESHVQVLLLATR